MTGGTTLREDLQAYRDAAGIEDGHALAARRRRLLPSLRTEATELRGAADLRTALVILEAAEQASFGPLPAADHDLREALAERLAQLPTDTYRVPVLLMDRESADGLVAELIVELTPAPGQGRTVAVGRTD